MNMVGHIMELAAGKPPHSAKCMQSENAWRYYRALPVDSRRPTTPIYKSSIEIYLVELV